MKRSLSCSLLVWRAVVITSVLVLRQSNKICFITDGFLASICWFLIVIISIVTRLEEELRVAHERINSLNSLSDGKVEKWEYRKPIHFSLISYRLIWRHILLSITNGLIVFNTWILSRSLSIDRWWKTCWWDILIHRKTNEWMLYESLEVCLASHTRSWIRYHHVARVFYIVVVFRFFSSFVFPFYQVGTGSSPPTGSWISNLIPFGPSAPKTPTRTTASAPKVWKRNYVH